MKVVITGANSAVGQAILRCAAELGALEGATPNAFVAVVRSDRAVGQVRHLLGNGNGVVRVSYQDSASLGAAFEGASAVIHLAGVLVERPGSTYEQANVASVHAVVEAAKRGPVKKIVLVSATGADETSMNRYYRSKGQAEALVRESGLCYTVLRAPRLLGPGTEGAAALDRNARLKKANLIGGGRNLQQPLYVDDLARAAIHASDLSIANNQTLDLVGPVSLSEREIVERAARLLGRTSRVRSIPKRLVQLALAIRQIVGRPGFSPDALEVIMADTSLDPQPAASALGIQLTGIDEMIENSLGERLKMRGTSQSTSTPSTTGEKKAKPWQRLLPYLITVCCFAYLYTRLVRAAAAEGSRLPPYLAQSFENVSWTRWLAMMIPYCVFYVLIDSLVVWSVINWFNAKIRYTDILPIRASAYILSLVNEQVSKGAIALYLNRRDGVPGWEVGSSMLFIMVCEYYSLMLWATIGVLLQWGSFNPAFHLIPWIALASAAFFTLFHLFFRGKILPGMALRDRPIFRAFRLARVSHYGTVIAMRAPLVIAGVVIYTLALRLFGGTVSFGEMLGYLPVIFFGAAMPGPMHSVAILFWVLLFPDKPGQMTTFGFVMHNFFILFNAAIGLLVLRRATRELFSDLPK